MNGRGRVSTSNIAEFNFSTTLVTNSHLTTTESLLAEIATLNANPNVHGILLQHPVPHQIDERACFDAISLAKDVDGVTCLGFGRMSMGEQAYGSATPQGIMTLLNHYQIPLEGKHAVVVGRSAILGKPMAMMLLAANATVTICHSRTQNLAELIKQADIVVGAVGKPQFIKSEWIKDGAVVVDAGYHAGGVGDIELAGIIFRACHWRTCISKYLGYSRRCHADHCRIYFLACQ